MTDLATLALEFCRLRRAYLDGYHGDCEEWTPPEPDVGDRGVPVCRSTQWWGQGGIPTEEWCDACKRRERESLATSRAWRRVTRALRKEQP